VLKSKRPSSQSPDTGTACGRPSVRVVPIQ
jgi:hypothetical protein